MSYCPECGLDFEDGPATCPDCRVELVEIFPQADQRNPFRDFKSVFICYSMSDAMLVQSLLEGRDIPCLRSDLDETPQGTMIGRDGQVRVLVPYEEVERASILIEESLLDGELGSIAGELVV